MELQTENGKKKAPLSTGLKWLRLVCMAVVFGIIAGGVMVGMNYLGGSMAAEEESIPQTSTVKVTAQAEDSDAVVAVARELLLAGQLSAKIFADAVAYFGCRNYLLYGVSVTCISHFCKIF